MTDRPLESQTARLQLASLSETKYEFTVIRVCIFTDNLVAQFQMTPDQTIGQLMSYLEELIDSQQLNQKLYLFTAPPKMVLSSESTFKEASLVPAAFIHLGGTETQNVLRSDLVDKVNKYEDVLRYTAALRKIQKQMGTIDS